jgi:hypothetical protein
LSVDDYLEGKLKADPMKWTRVNSPYWPMWDILPILDVVRALRSRGQKIEVLALDTSEQEESVWERDFIESLPEPARKAMGDDQLWLAKERYVQGKRDQSYTDRIREILQSDTKARVILLRGIKHIENITRELNEIPDDFGSELPVLGFARRSEARSEEVRRPAVDFAGQVARRVVQLIWNSEKVSPRRAGEVTESLSQTLTVVPVETFVQTLRSEARLLLKEIEDERAPKPELQITKDLSERAIQFLTRPEIVKQLKGDLVLAFDSPFGPSLLDALKKVDSGIGLLLFQKERLKGLTRDTLEKELGGRSFLLQELAKIRPSQLSAFENRAVPLVNDTLAAPYLGENPLYFGIGVNGAQIEGEPFLEVTEKVLQIVSGLLVASKIKNRSELRNPARLREIRAEVLRDLFHEDAHPDIIAFQNGHLVIHRGLLQNYLLERFAEEALERAA